MIETYVLTVSQRALIEGLWILGPLVAIGLAVGLLVSIFQALTQIQDPTLAFVLKILSTFAGLLIFGNFILKKLTTLTVNLIERIPQLPEILR
ncbi:MAG: flagellar biosynthetic protein FliQ [Deltaproteobacteria bacterium]|nr:flagellar biosynthetic protein FliQ [Deltaproteobacteria bacterium]MCX7953422.1 flagellar biosynthetic protein FliQ [Deltaproteobacteria bacterium]